MERARFRSRAGIALIEAMASGFMASVAIVGLAVSVCYGRQLERTTQTTWRATAAATATLEQIRSESIDHWAAIPTNWNSTSCADSGFSDAIAGNLVAAVDTTTASLDDAAGMWSAGATAPNFYFVQVTPSATSDVARSLVFQTYVTNRSGTIWGTDVIDTGDIYSHAISSTTATSTTSAGKISTSGAYITISGEGGKYANVELQNTSSTSSPFTTFKVTAPTTVKIDYISVNGVVLFNNPSKAANAVSVTTCATLMPAGLAPGTVDIQIHSSAATLSDKTVSYGFVFTDKSTKTVTVTP